MYSLMVASYVTLAKLLPAVLPRTGSGPSRCLTCGGCGRRARRRNQSIGGDEHKECGHTSVPHETKQDLNDNRRQEHKHRAEHSGGYRPHGPGCKTVHGITGC